MTANIRPAATAEYLHYTTGRYGVNEGLAVARTMLGDEAYGVAFDAWETEIAILNRHDADAIVVTERRTR